MSYYSFYRPTEGRRLSRPSWQASHRVGLPARNVLVYVFSEKYSTAVNDHAQQELDQLNHLEVLSENVRRKDDQAKAARARMLATRKALMLGRTANQTLAESRRKVGRDKTDFCSIFFPFR